MMVWDISQFYQEFSEKGTTELRFSFPDESELAIVNALISRVLAERDLTFLMDTLITVMRELIFNALKANAKRLFYAEKNLDLECKGECDKAITEFNRIITESCFPMEESIRSSSYRIRLMLKNVGNGIEVVVQNNVILTTVEKEKITWRLEKGESEKHFNDIYDKAYDSTEGAGLGLILIQFLLKNAGFSHPLLTLEATDQHTAFTFFIPNMVHPAQQHTSISEDIITEVDNLPTLPAYAAEISEMSRNPRVAIDSIVDRISHDPVITSEVLRLARTAAFSGASEVSNLKQAVMKIGLVNLDSLVMAVVTRRVLESRYSRLENIWNHCNRVAAASRHLAIQLSNQKYADRAFIGGLLHDIGRIILLATDEALIKKISVLLDNRKIRTSSILEETAIGISHTTIGRLMAEKWQLPDYVINSIAYHHSPRRCPEKEKAVVEMVYLANLIEGIIDRRYHYQFADLDLLEKYSIDSGDSFHALVESTEKFLNEQVIF